jgi:hypothetical protein
MWLIRNQATRPSTARRLKRIDWDQMYKRYGQPNDLLVRLNIFNFRVHAMCRCAPCTMWARKAASGRSLMIPKLSWLLLKWFVYRMKEKYVIRDFHPLVFFYLLWANLFPLGTFFRSVSVHYRLLVGPVSRYQRPLCRFCFCLRFAISVFCYVVRHGTQSGIKTTQRGVIHAPN